ncbi:hypothetical protein TNCV_4684871 [Trichonephila clavipes]|nr:hypothetical protein TNCV_4684871 [Trichonephila clavipes]
MLKIPRVLDWLGKIKFLVQFRIVRAQVPPSEWELSVKIALWQLISTFLWCRTKKKIPAFRECARSTMFPCRNCGKRGGVAIYRPIGEFRRANSYCHLYGVQGQQQAYF